jgi:hypothetical protein
MAQSAGTTVEMRRPLPATPIGIGRFLRERTEGRVFVQVAVDIGSPSSRATIGLAGDPVDCYRGTQS